ncbi:MAG TPA: sulfotransferase family 2 domain-containing protein [Ideonella sp.]|uniref:sulfotransferase family 2 domain-containing protein n=1 Tax=Ideonella sp. TaxID=1929293 RepID=UPI002C280A51|nr:sulfotransferase family 2 domain-containing protein [Ideonella sp.]HSI50734.1 sulfotransferase family 2 domain-containing protein [Ideonella sp.]
MTLEDLLARIQATEPEALAGLPPAAVQRLMCATLRELREGLLAQPDAVDAPVQVPLLGRFRRVAAPGQGWRFIPHAAAQQAGPSRAGASVDPVTRAWRKACNSVEPALIHPEHKFLLLFSPKSACSSAVIWFMHTMGLAGEARAYSEWPHDYRIHKLMASDAQRATRQIPAEQLTVLRVVRDPLERAVSSFRHALGTSYARAEILKKLGRDTWHEGLSFQQFIDFLALEDLDACNPHHRRQCHAVERLHAPDVLINASRQDLFAGLNDFERRMGMPVTDFAGLRWLHDVQSKRVPERADDGQPADQVVLTREQAKRGPWPHQLLTPLARERLTELYADDIARYAVPH